jgi:Flp pilus assembly protein TadG
MPKLLTQNLWIKNWRRLALRTDGNEIAEAAAVLPLLFMVLIGIFWFGQAFRIYGTITRAAQEGARAAVAPACSTCAALTSTPAANAYNAISNVLTTARLETAKLSRPTSTPAAVSCNGSPVSCDATEANICVQTNIQLSDTVTGTGVCGVAVSFQYPYQFWLPFASLNQQRIQIPAAARVRQETQ